MKRLWKDVLVALIICGGAGEALYLGVVLYRQQNYWGSAFVFGALLGLVMLIGPAQDRARRSIHRRRQPDLGSVAVESVSPFVFRGHALENKRGLDQRIRVKVDGVQVILDLTELWQILLDEKANNSRSCLSWTRYVLEQGMELNRWAAYRKVLVETQCVDILGTGALRLNVQPWEAVERARIKYARRNLLQFLRGRLK